MLATGTLATPWPGWRGLADRLLASPRFRAWAAAFPLTRPVARRRARELFDVVAGFVYSQVLTACVELGLFDLLAEGAVPAPTLARLLALPEGAASRLLEAAASLELVERRGADASGQPCFGLGRLGVAMIGNPGLRAMVAHHRLLYADLREPVALLRGQAGPTALGGYWPYATASNPAELSAAQTDSYTTLMAASQPMVATEVLAAYRFGRHRCLLDVGGGDGSFLAAVGARAPGLRLLLFDLPPVAARARARFAAEGLSGRATADGGDFRRDPLPVGADIISLVRVAHDHSDAVVLALLRAARRALPPGGTVLLAEPMAATRGAAPIGDAYFGFYLLAMGSGRARTAAEYAALLRESGFERPRLRPTNTPLLASVMVARAKSSSPKDDRIVSLT